MEITCGIYLYSIPRKKILACHAARTAKTNWSIPKGLKDENEDCFTAALRELFEETGIDLQKRKDLTAHDFAMVKYQKRNKWLQSYLISVNDDFATHKFVCRSMVDNEFPEIDKWEWMSLEEAVERLHESQQKNAALILQTAILDDIL